MAGGMRKVGEYLGLVTQVDYDDFEYDDYDEPAQIQPVARQAPRPVTTIHDRRVEAPVETSVLKRIESVTPLNYNDARPIGEAFRDGVPVVMNLSEIGEDDAKRLVDFSAGLVFAAHGSLRRITAKVFLLLPANVEFSDEDKAAITADGFYNQS